MDTKNIQIDRETYAKVLVLATKLARSVPEVLEQAVENLRRQLFLEESNAAYAALQQDAKAWQAELDERAIWETTLSDGKDIC